MAGWFYEHCTFRKDSTYWQVSLFCCSIISSFCLFYSLNIKLTILWFHSGTVTDSLSSVYESQCPIKNIFDTISSFDLVKPRSSKNTHQADLAQLLEWALSPSLRIFGGKLLMIRTQTHTKKHPLTCIFLINTLSLSSYTVSYLKDTQQYSKMGTVNGQRGQLSKPPGALGTSAFSVLTWQGSLYSWMYQWRAHAGAFC